VQLLGRGPYEALLIPEAAIASDQAQRFVFVVDLSNVVQRRTIELGRRVGDLRIVAHGLAPDDLVVVSGIHRARHGTLVTATTVATAHMDDGSSGGGP
jgi:multidrug efflux pump subunit AcrA (membrane-fusion protein)